MVGKSNRIGNTTELSCMAAFANLGYGILIPYGNGERYDFVAELNGKFIRIQVKTAQISKDESCIEISCRSANIIGKKAIYKTYTKEEIDYFATFYNNKCYLIPVEECGTAKFLRLKPTVSGQIKNIHYAENYELEKVLNAIT